MSPFVNTLSKIEKTIGSRLLPTCGKIRVDGSNSGIITLCFTCWTSEGYHMKFAKYKNFRMYKYPSSKLTTDEEINAHLSNEERLISEMVNELSDRCLSEYIK